jgi:hypothetical protein
MLWRSAPNALPAAERFRRAHERWLNMAIVAAMPRIPVRRVDEGGFDDLLARARGRAAADRWWRRAFARVPDVE